MQLRENQAACFHEVAHWHVSGSLTRGIFNAVPHLEAMFNLLHPPRRQDFSKGVCARGTVERAALEIALLIPLRQDSSIQRAAERMCARYRHV